MFGKPDWFTKKRLSWGIAPNCWQGWSYTAVWLAVFVLPFLLLLSERLMIESLVWLSAATGAFVWDLRQILAAMHPADEDVLYVDETETLSEQFATRNFDFRLRG